ncbi:MAG: glutamate--tRNA ligase [Phycisphaeraceae bacterium]
MAMITRFAPSPTGSLHVGGARTALFAWALARRHEGTFILRIEDTDQARSTPEATRGILRDMQWLGLDWDAGPPAPPAADDPAYPQWDPYQAEHADGRASYFQSQRHAAGVYAEQIDRLLASGRAYKCFKTTEQLDAERQAARKQKRPYRYDPTEALALTAEQVAAYEAEGRPHAIRFRMPDETLVVEDDVLGELRFEPEQQEDFVIRKADGFPTYHLAVVVDDAAMGVTHVVRGQEHLNNTPKHVALQAALGFERPRYAHIPLIFNADGSKMSKRDKAKAARAAAKEAIKQEGHEAFEARILNPRTMSMYEADPDAESGSIADQLDDFLDRKNDSILVARRIADVLSRELPEIDVQLPEINVDDFRQAGYLPEVLCNYLALLGWSPGEDVERFGPDPLGFIRDRFDLARVGKANARFDREKLFRFNAEAIAAMDAARFRELVYHLETNAELRGLFDGPEDPRFADFCEAYQERSRTLREPVEAGRFFFVEDEAIVYDEKAVAKVLAKGDGDGFNVLRELREKLTALDDFTAEVIHSLIQAHAEATGRGMGKVAQPLRVAVTGTSVSPPIDKTLAILGKASVVRRIERCLTMEEA